MGSGLSQNGCKGLEFRVRGLGFRPFKGLGLGVQLQEEMDEGLWKFRAVFCNYLNKHYKSHVGPPADGN